MRKREIRQEKVEAETKVIHTSVQSSKEDKEMLRTHAPVQKLQEEDPTQGSTGEALRRGGR